MTDYLKLVRPDYKSFYDESFQWPVNGIVEISDAAPDGPCGKGLHLAKKIEGGLKYATFPFRILKVIPLSPILGEDDDKIRVAKAQSLGELPVPEWAVNLEKKIKKIQEDVKIIPWFKGTDEKKAKTLIRTHFKLLVPFGFKLDFDIEILKSWAAAWDAAWDAARDAAGVAAGVAAWVAAWDAARDAARAAAWDAAGDLLKQKNPFTPLWEVHKLGFWPIGFNGKKFMLFSEKAK